MTSPIWIVWWLTLVAQVGFVAWVGRRWAQGGSQASSHHSD